MHGIAAVDSGSNICEFDSVKTNGVLDMASSKPPWRPSHAHALLLGMLACACLRWRTPSEHHVGI